ncbi:hypothetical protein [Massilia frigida]|nr:hypothetical protein [Massilia frigida]
MRVARGALSAGACTPIPVPRLAIGSMLSEIDATAGAPFIHPD